MDALYALFFAGGAAAFGYTKLGRRAGYGNTQNVAILTGMCFVIAYIVCFTAFKFIFHI